MTQPRPTDIRPIVERPEYYLALFPEAPEQRDADACGLWSWPAQDTVPKHTDVFARVFNEGTRPTWLHRGAQWRYDAIHPIEIRQGDLLIWGLPYYSYGRLEPAPVQCVRSIKYKWCSTTSRATGVRRKVPILCVHTRSGLSTYRLGLRHFRTLLRLQPTA